MQAGEESNPALLPVSAASLLGWRSPAVVEIMSFSQFPLCEAKSRGRLGQGLSTQAWLLGGLGFKF